MKLSEFTKHSIRSLGLDEYWLQEQIYNEPSILGLGDNIQEIRREKRQSSGGKLDVMLFDQDQNTMYEVEIMLGDTDPSHIIRSLEYWDLERRKYPQRQHYAVLVAERITRRFYNVIQMLSMNFPMIAIQVEMIKIDDSYVLNFVKVLDVYEEIEMDIPEESVDEQYWNKNNDWILRSASNFKHMLEPEFPGLGMNFVKTYIALTFGNKNIVNFFKRAKPNFKVEVKARYSMDIIDKLKAYLNENNLTFEFNDRYKIFVFSLNEKVMKSIEKTFKTFLTMILSEVVKDKDASEDDNE